jgi:hypothetical protein
VIADGKRSQRHDRGDAPAHEDQRPPSITVGEVTAEIPADSSGQRAAEESEGELKVGRTESLDRPDPHEHPQHSACDRARQGHSEDREQRPVDLAADDTLHQRPQPHPRVSVALGQLSLMRGSITL